MRWPYVPTVRSVKGREGTSGGHLHPAGLSSPGPLHVTPDGPNDYWAGGNPVSVPVRLIAHYPDGSSAETTVQIELQPGWG